MFAAGVGYRDKNTRGSESDVLDAVKIFVEAGLDLAPVNARGETALHGAAERGADTIVSFLVEHGAELNVKTKAGIHPARRRDGQSQPWRSCRFPNQRPFPCCESSEASKPRT